MSVNRYYAQFTDTCYYFNAPGSSWQVFDRTLTDERGEAQAVAVCLDRRVAFTVRDALNAVEDREK